MKRNKFTLEEDLPLIQTFGNKRFSVFAYIALEGDLKTNYDTVSAPNHFVTHFVINGTNLRYNGLASKPRMERRPKGGKVAFVCLIELT